MRNILEVPFPRKQCRIASSGIEPAVNNLSITNPTVFEQSQPPVNPDYRVDIQIKSFIILAVLRRLTSWRGPSPRHCPRETQLLSKKCHSGGEPLATLSPIWPAKDLNLRPPAPETNALSLNQLASRIDIYNLENAWSPKVLNKHQKSSSSSKMLKTFQWTKL